MRSVLRACVCGVCVNFTCVFVILGSYCYVLICAHNDADAGSNTVIAVRVVYAVAALWAGLYAYYWDVKMDWGLAQPNCKPRFLRSKLMYKPIAVYYVAIVEDLFLRFAWLLSLSPVRPAGFNIEMWLLIVSLLEVFRYVCE